MLTICAWHRADMQVYRMGPNNPWKPVHQYILNMIKSGTPVSHGICCECYERVTTGLERDTRRDAFLELKRNARTGEIEEA